MQPFPQFWGGKTENSYNPIIHGMKAQQRSVPIVSSSSTTLGLYLQELLKGYLGKQWPGMCLTAYTPRWKVEPNSSDSFQNLPLRVHQFPPLITLFISFRKLDYDLHMSYVEAGRDFSGGRRDSAFHLLVDTVFLFNLSGLADKCFFNKMILLIL